MLCGGLFKHKHALNRKLRRDKLKGTGNHFQIDNDIPVSSVIERMKNKLAGDHKLRIRLDKLEELRAKSGLDPFIDPFTIRRAPIGRPFD